jgi:hypothetical protein
MEERVQDLATLQAIRLVSRSGQQRLTTTDHRLLKQLADRASEEARRKYWPQIWGDFAELFDPR